MSIDEIWKEKKPKWMQSVSLRNDAFLALIEEAKNEAKRHNKNIDEEFIEQCLKSAIFSVRKAIAKRLVYYEYEKDEINNAIVDLCIRFDFIFGKPSYNLIAKIFNVIKLKDKTTWTAESVRKRFKRFEQKNPPDEFKRLYHNEFIKLYKKFGPEWIKLPKSKKASKTMNP